MKIFVQAKTGVKNPKIIVKDDTHLVVSVSSRPIDGKANDAIARALSLHFSVSLSSVVLLSGGSSRTKLFEILR